MFRLLLPQFYDERWISLSLFWKIVCFASHNFRPCLQLHTRLTALLTQSGWVWWPVGHHWIILMSISFIALRHWLKLTQTHIRSIWMLQPNGMVAGCHCINPYFSPNPLLISSSSCCHAAGCTHQPISSTVQHLQHPTSHIINPRIMMLHA